MLPWLYRTRSDFSYDRHRRVAPISRLQARRILDEIEQGMSVEDSVVNLVARKLKMNSVRICST